MLEEKHPQTHLLIPNYQRGEVRINRTREALLQWGELTIRLCQAWRVPPSGLPRTCGQADGTGPSGTRPRLRLRKRDVWVWGGVKNLQEEKWTEVSDE